MLDTISGKIIIFIVFVACVFGGFHAYEAISERMRLAEYHRCVGPDIPGLRSPEEMQQRRISCGLKSATMDGAGGQYATASAGVIRLAAVERPSTILKWR